MSKTCKWKVLASTEQRPTGLSPKGYRALIRSGRGSRHGGKSRHELKQDYDVCSTDNVVVLVPIFIKMRFYSMLNFGDFLRVIY